MISWKKLVGGTAAEVAGQQVDREVTGEQTGP